MTVEDYKNKGRWAYSKRVEGKRVMTTSASVWYNLKRRCADNVCNPTYSDCELDESFQDFQNFAEWYTTQIGYGLGYHLDKDILVSGNKIYGPETCVLVPRELNNFLCSMDARRGCYKQGVSLHKRNKTFVAYISLEGVSTYLGSYDSEAEAYRVYKVAKESEAIQWAKLLSNFVVDGRVIEALNRYKLIDKQPAM